MKIRRVPGVLHPGGDDELDRVGPDGGDLVHGLQVLVDGPNVLQLHRDAAQRQPLELGARGRCDSADSPSPVFTAALPDGHTTHPTTARYVASATPISKRPFMRHSDQTIEPDILRSEWGGGK